jgi:subtilase family serine protease
MAPTTFATGSPAGQFIANNTPKFVAKAKNLGPEDQSKVIDVTIWLNLHNRSELDSMAKELYDPNSSHYHQWLRRDEFATTFAPTAQEAGAVEQFLVSHNLRVTAVGPHNFFVRARGTVGDTARAFHVRMNKFEVNGKTQRANSGDPYVEGPAAVFVRSISGLDDMQFQHPMVTRASQISNKLSQSGRFATAASSANSEFFSSHCFTGVKTETQTSNGTFPTATYKGNGYFSPPTEPGCGYTPPEIQKAYNLTGLYNEGFDGTGQTIVIIDFCGSPSILQDANAFSAKFGLPALDSSNFNIINHPSAQCSGPNFEINLDVEWAHAIAPGAKIDLLIAGSGFVSEADEAEYFAVINGLGNVISGSYGLPEYFLTTTELENENLLNEIAAVFGVSANFASGDGGDYTFIGYGSTVSAPADSPYATAIGGVSLALNPTNTIAFQTGWGNNETLLTDTGFIYDPPSNYGFAGGSGGGASGIFPKPSYQTKLAGMQRQLPDVSWLADPFTGGVVLITQPGMFPPQTWVAVGGTSLACPMFSALWAIANQEAGIPLGQAAPYLYSMPKGTITDVLAIGSATDVTADIHESSSTVTHYSANDLAQPLLSTTKFYTFLWDYPFLEDTRLVITLGTDSGLTTTAGWDNVTGLGTPNAKAFADFFNPASQH